MKMSMLKLLALVGAVLLARPTLAAQFRCTVGNTACLISRINLANSNGAANTIILEGGTYFLTRANNNTDGPNGLPSITSPLTIQGQGNAVIERVETAEAFRLLHVKTTGRLTLSGVTLRGGNALVGGAILNRGGSVIITDSNIIHNSASSGIGGGISNGFVTDKGEGFTFRFQVIREPGGLVTLTNSRIVENSASFGGGIGNLRGTVQIAGSSVTDNTAVVDGGGVLNLGALVMTNSTVARNFAGSAAGIVNHFSEAATAFLFGQLIVLNSTLAGNFSRFYGAISNLLGGTLYMLNSTITDNTGEEAIGGINGSLDDGASLMQNTILAGNHSAGPRDCAERITSLGNNIIGDVSGCEIILQSGDRAGNPGLADFTDDGLPGHGHVPLLESSQAINRGNNAVCIRGDQLGQLRVARCDIGAIEFQP